MKNRGSRIRIGRLGAPNSDFSYFWQTWITSLPLLRSFFQYGLIDDKIANPAILWHIDYVSSALQDVFETIRLNIILPYTPPGVLSVSPSIAARVETAAVQKALPLGRINRRQARLKNATTPCWTNQPWPHSSNQMASGKPGVGQTGVIGSMLGLKRTTEVSSPVINIIGFDGEGR